ncbi:MAG: rhamnan synthesis F family protein [Caulobacteraceae bacterium]
MTRWRERSRVLAQLARAPANFLRSKTYRAALLHGLVVGESLLAGDAAPLPLARPRSPIDEGRLDLLPALVQPAVHLATPGIGPQDLIADEAAFRLLAAAAETGARVRVTTLGVAPGEHELGFRLALEQRFGLSRTRQARLDVLDGATQPAVCAADDTWFAAGPTCLRLVRDALARRGLSRAEVHSVDEGGAVLRRLDAGTPAGDHGSTGLGYRMLKAPPKDFHPRRPCLFVHFDPHDRVDPYVRRYLAALDSCGLDLILISSSDLSAEAFDEVAPLVAAAVCRENRGLDFAGWALAMELFPQVLEGDGLLIANDSVYGPVGDLAGMFARMEQRRLDAWGVAESFERGAQHVQSWFVWFERTALASPAFRRFWDEVLPLTDKDAIINGYELPLLPRLRDAGLSVGAVAPFPALGEVVCNPTARPWCRLLAAGAPFLKVQLLREAPQGADLTGWTSEVDRAGFPVALMLDHLQRVYGQAAAGLRTR